MKTRIFKTTIIMVTLLLIAVHVSAQTVFPVTVNPIPTAYNVGSSSTTYCAGTAGVSITLANSQIGVNYQLYKGGAIQGATIPGTGAALAWAGQQFGTYTVVGINGTTLCDANMTGSVVITQNPIPLFTAQPTNATICENGNTSFSVTVTGAISYAWEESTNGGTTWNPIINGGIYSGATTTTLTLTAVTLPMNNYQYRCVATTTLGCSANSNAATLTVNPLPIITVQPPATTACDQQANVTISITDNGVAHQWWFSINNGVSWNTVTNGAVYSGATTTTLNIITATTAMNNYQYRCVVTSVSGCTITSNAAILTVNALPTAYLVGASANRYCAGTSGVTITLSNSTVGVNYDLLLGGISTGNILAGTGAAISWPNQLSGTYTVNAVNSVTTCNRLMTGSQTIIEDPLPTAGVVTWSEPCSDGQVSVTINNLTGTSPWTISIYDQVAGVPGSIIYSQSGINSPSPTLMFTPNWVGTENKYIWIQDQHCGAWK